MYNQIHWYFPLWVHFWDYVGKFFLNPRIKYLSILSPNAFRGYYFILKFVFHLKFILK